MADRTINLDVYRYNPDVDARPYFDRYELPFRHGMTVLDSLFDVLEKKDGSLAFRYSCREAICGACAMFVNGHYVLACQTQVDSLKTDNITVGPLPHLKVIKDLVVDMTPFWNNYKSIMPYLVERAETQEKENLQSPGERLRIDDMVSCVLCASCYSSCPATWTGNRQFLGPSAMQKAARFAFDTRDAKHGERVDLVSTEAGLFRCHAAFNCMEACPKDIPVSEAIHALKRASVARRLGIGRK